MSLRQKKKDFGIDKVIVLRMEQGKHVTNLYCVGRCPLLFLHTFRCSLNPFHYFASHSRSLHVEPLEPTYLNRLSSFTTLQSSVSCLLHVRTSATPTPEDIISSILLYFALSILPFLDPRDSCHEQCFILLETFSYECFSSWALLPDLGSGVPALAPV